MLSVTRSYPPQSSVAEGDLHLCIHLLPAVPKLENSNPVFPKAGLLMPQIWQFIKQSSCFLKKILSDLSLNLGSMTSKLSLPSSSLLAGSDNFFLPYLFKITFSGSLKGSVKCFNHIIHRMSAKQLRFSTTQTNSNLHFRRAINY